jgi:hypothetical protein
MHFIYSDEKEPYKGRATPYNQLPANRFFLTHFQNSQYLNFILKHQETTPIEKIQAQKELGIADKKMEYWKRHPNFDLTYVTQETTKIKTQWKK